MKSVIIVAMAVLNAGIVACREGRDLKGTDSDSAVLPAARVHPATISDDARRMAPVTDTSTSDDSAVVSSASGISSNTAAVDWINSSFRRRPGKNGEHALSPVSAVFVDNGKAVFSVDQDGLITRWDLSVSPAVPSYHLDLNPGNTGQGWTTWSASAIVRLSEHAVLAQVSNELRCIDFDTKAQHLLEYDLPETEFSVAVSADRTLLLSGGMSQDNSSWAVYSLPKGCNSASRSEPSVLRIAATRFKKGDITSGAFDAANRYMALGTSQGVIMIWPRTRVKLPTRSGIVAGGNDGFEIERPKILLGPIPRSASGMAFGPGGLLVAGYYDGQVIVWDVAAKKSDNTFFMKNAYPVRVAFSSDGQWVAAGGVDGSLWLWNLTSSRLLNVPMAHSFRLTGLDFSADDTTLLTASIDGTFSIWQLPNEKKDDLTLVQSFGERKLPPKLKSPVKNACDRVEAQMQNAYFYLNEEERGFLGRHLMRATMENASDVYSGIKCHKNKNGSAWGILPHDVNALFQSARLWLVHADKAGNMVYGGRHRFWLEASYGLEIAYQGYFDFDEDGDDEVMWTQQYWDQEDDDTEKARRTLAVKSFQNGRIVNYDTKNHAESVADIDDDGKPDLVVGAMHTVRMRSCGPTGEFSTPVGPSRVAFNMGNGEFSLTGKKAEKYYRDFCPANDSILKDVQDGEIIDNEQLQQNIVCAVLYGNSVDKIQSEINAFCQFRRIESACMNDLWMQPRQKGCVGVKQLLDIATTIPPLILK